MPSTIPIPRGPTFKEMSIGFWWSRVKVVTNVGFSTKNSPVALSKPKRNSRFNASVRIRGSDCVKLAKFVRSRPRSLMVSRLRLKFHVLVSRLKFARNSPKRFDGAALILASSIRSPALTLFLLLKTARIASISLWKLVLISVARSASVVVKKLLTASPTKGISTDPSASVTAVSKPEAQFASSWSPCSILSWSESEEARFPSRAGRGKLAICSWEISMDNLMAGSSVAFINPF